jgi:hypothetical protein
VPGGAPGETFHETPHGTRGAEARPALAYPSADPVPEASRFVALPADEAVASLAAATRAGAWSALRRGGEERRSAGNFLCRLETRFGRAPIIEPSRVVFVVRDAESGLVLTAYADAAGPAFGAVLGDPPDPFRQTQAAHAAIALATLLDATVPGDCSYPLGGREVGVEGGSYR